ncbi:MAG: hypothetical protein ACREL5_04190 [Gemmatimonadales bacterium]
MIHLFAEAVALQRILREGGWPFCFIGGVALQHWGEPRTTRDLDLAVFTGFGGEASVVDALLSRYRGRVPDARQFALEHRVLLLETDGSVPADIALGALPFEREMMARAVEVEFAPDATLRICTAEDLVIMKAFADRPQDRIDVAGVARRQKNRLDWSAVLERLTPLAEAKEDPTILARIRELRDRTE